MCCFSGDVRAVSNTRIFGRLAGRDIQVLIYAMSVDAPAEVAMVLPIPVNRAVKGKPLEFVDLSKYPTLFDDMAKSFEPTRGGKFAVAAAAPSRGALAVEKVGEFEASFVPTVADFARLDPRFQMPAGTWDKLPGYKNFSFAVFKLKPGAQKVHPMAFTFHTAKPGQIFFPTVHIHDGEVHQTAEFDHTLYSQADGVGSPNWMESSQLPTQHMKIPLTQNLVLPDVHLQRRNLWGNKTNSDVLLTLPK